MSFNSFSNVSISTLASDTQRAGAMCYRMTFKGLRPNTKHKMYLENVDFSWACRTYGKNIGEDMISDENGDLIVFVYYEIPFVKPADFEIDETQSVAYSSSRINNTNRRMEDAVSVQWKSFEVRSDDGLSHAILNMHFHIPIVNLTE